MLLPEPLAPTIDTYSSWMDAHRRRGWVTSAKKPVANRDILEQLIAARDARRAAGKPDVVLEHVRGHAGHRLNSWADERAVRHGASLQHLLQVSSRLRESTDVNDLLQAVVDGIRRALGFERVSIELTQADGSGFTPRSSTGWGSAGPPPTGLTPETIAPLLAQTSATVDAEPSALPSAVDLRQWFSPIEDQGQLGSCTAIPGCLRATLKRSFIRLSRGCGRKIIDNRSRAPDSSCQETSRSTRFPSYGAFVGVLPAKSTTGFRGSS